MVNVIRAVILFFFVFLPITGLGQEQSFLIDSTYVDTPQGKHVISGWHLMREDSLTDALEDINEAISIDPTYEEAWLLRAYIYSELNNAAEEIFSYSKLIELSPDNAHYRLIRATAKEQYEDYYGALADMDFLRDINPDFAEIYFYRGRVYSKLNNYTYAINNFNMALQLNTSNKEETLMLMGKTYLELNNFDNAIKTFDKIIELNNDFTTEALYMKGSALIKAGKRQEGCTILSESLNKGYDSALNTIRWECRR